MPVVSSTGVTVRVWPQTTKVFVNGVWVGIHRDPSMLVNTLRRMRRQIDISTEVITQPPRHSNTLPACALSLPSPPLVWRGRDCLMQLPILEHELGTLLTVLQPGQFLLLDVCSRSGSEYRIWVHVTGSWGTEELTDVLQMQVGIVHDIRLQELRLYTDYGRCCRPLFVVENQELLITKQHIIRLIEGQQADQDEERHPMYWNDLVEGGLVE